MQREDWIRVALVATILLVLTGIFNSFPHPKERVTPLAAGER